MKAIIPLLCLLLGLAASHAAPPWQEALGSMPLPADAPLLDRDNAVFVLLHAFRSNDVVKALMVLPEVSDDSCLIHRDQPKLNLRATNLLEALSQLTNVTALRLTFRAPFLLAHLASGRLADWKHDSHCPKRRHRLPRINRPLTRTPRSWANLTRRGRISPAYSAGSASFRLSSLPKSTQTLALSSKARVASALLR